MFLTRRDGVDKVLKLLRYGSRMGWWWMSLANANDVAERLASFEKACNAARKAMRIGKVGQFDISRYAFRERRSLCV